MDKISYLKYKAIPHYFHNLLGGGVAGWILFNKWLAKQAYAVKTVFGNGFAEWFDGVKSVFPSVKMLGKVEQVGNPTPDAPKEVKPNNATVKCTNADGTYDGGEATAPPLLCAVNGSCQSTYDAQTGEFVNWWWDKITFDGSEIWSKFSDRNGFACWDKIPEVMWRNAYWCNQCSPLEEGGEYYDGRMYLLVGANSQSMYVCHCPFYDDTLDDGGIANWKAHLAQHPMEVWLARNEPEITNIGQQRLTCPEGYGQIVQVAGDVPNCPLEVEYRVRESEES